MGTPPSFPYLKVLVEQYHVNGRPDIIVEKDDKKIAVEIETGKSDVVGNIQRALEAGRLQGRGAFCLNYDIWFACQSRIDAQGALHHIIARGIERKRIFTDGVDRDNFLNRLGKL